MTKKKSIHKIKIQNYYRTLIITFSIAVVIVLALIVYFSFSNTIIWVTVSDEPYTVSTLIEIVNNPEDENTSEPAVAGVVFESNVSLTNEYAEVTVGSEVESKATGQVTIHNNYSSTQPLIATTRLLSETGILFRTDERVDVPPGGQVSVSVTADQPGLAGEVEPMRFTIPGLWPGLQDKIYGESTEKMTGGTTTTTVATLDNIVKAKNDNFQAAYNQALDDIETQLNYLNADYKIQATKKELLSEEASVEPNAQVNSFYVTTSLHVVALSYNADEVIALAHEKTAGQLPNNTKLTLDTDTPYTYVIDNFNVEDQVASLRVTISGTKNVTLSHSMFDRIKLVNMDRNDVQRYFAQFPKVENVEIQFSPFWVFRTPTLVDNIEVRIR